MALSTIAAIRDRCHVLIEALTPALLTADKFRRYRNEGDGDFAAWAEANPEACFRRFQIRQTGLEELPHTSSVLEERVRLQLTARVAYPQSHRYGPDNALDRDDVLNQDWLRLNGALGIYGAANFTGTHDCIPLGATMERDEGDGVDFMLVHLDLEFLRSTT